MEDRELATERVQYAGTDASTDDEKAKPYGGRARTPLGDVEQVAESSNAINAGVRTPAERTTGTATDSVRVSRTPSSIARTRST